MCERWLKEAEWCKSDGSSHMCEAIIKATATISMEIEVEDRLDTWDVLIPYNTIYGLTVTPALNFVGGTFPKKEIIGITRCW